MKVGIVGAGASGLMLAGLLKKKGFDVYVFDKNEKCGKKLYITGKGRCNLTNYCLQDEFLKNVVRGEKFLRSAIYNFPPSECVKFFNDLGLETKVERGNRVFPVSDKAADVAVTLHKASAEAGAVFSGHKVTDVLAENGEIKGLVLENGEKRSFQKVIIATGGKSYPLTGSTGDGYAFAQKLGHTIIPLKPSLVPIESPDKFCRDMQGLSLKNVKLTVYFGQKKLSEEMGEMLFTHFGISGPLVLTASSLITRLDLNSVKLSLDLKPALDEQTLDRRLLRDFGENSNKSTSNCLKNLMPDAIIREVLKRAGIPSEKKVNNVSRAERALLLTTVKNFDILISSLRGFEEAIITSGGVNVKDINPKTM